MRYVALSLLLASCSGCVAPRLTPEPQRAAYEAVFPGEGKPKHEVLYVCGYVDAVIKCVPLDYWLKFQEENHNEGEVRKEAQL